MPASQTLRTEHYICSCLMIAVSKICAVNLRHDRES